MPAPLPPFDYDAAVLACARGERYALQALYERESRWLLGVALRIVRDRAQAEDVLHDAFVDVWRQAAGFDPALGSARGWLYTVVRHRALKALRGPDRLVALAPEALDAFVGEYRSEDATVRSVRREGGKLLLVRQGRDPVALQAHAANGCFMDGTLTTIEFQRGDDGRVSAMWLRQPLNDEKALRQ